jgi:hypothetical protein
MCNGKSSNPFIDGLTTISICITLGIEFLKIKVKER